jgi:hypothetical protein
MRENMHTDVEKLYIGTDTNINEDEIVIHRNGKSNTKSERAGESERVRE